MDKKRCLEELGVLVSCIEADIDETIATEMKETLRYIVAAAARKRGLPAPVYPRPERMELYAPVFQDLGWFLEVVEPELTDEPKVATQIVLDAIQNLSS